MFNKSTPVAVVIFILFFLSASNLFSVEVKKKEISDFEAFQKGTFRGTALDSKGSLFIGPRITDVTGPTLEYYLSVDVGKDGSIYVGTGHKASVFKIKQGFGAVPSITVANPAVSGTQGKKQNNIQEVFKTDDLDVYALLVKSNGDIYAGTSPDGKIYKIVKNAGQNSSKNNAAQKGQVFFDPEEKFIWDIKEDITGNIIAATGNSGGVYRINKDGNGINIFSSEDNHIVSLYITRSNSILAGSGDRGILYKIDNMKVKVLFDSPFEEIRGICEDKEGNIYFSATRGIKQQNIHGNAVVETFLKKKKKPEKKVPVEQSVLYIKRMDGTVEQLWSSKTEYIYSVCYDASDDSVLFGTGNFGRVYRADKDGNYSIAYESNAAQVFKIIPMTKSPSGNGGCALITNNTATITRIDDSLNSKGLYFSEIYDLGIQSRLGKIYWEGETPLSTGISLSVRTGNSNVPDATWSKWSAPFIDKDNSIIGTADVRYFQVKAVLNSSNTAATPQLNHFKVYYVQSNLKPHLKTIEIIKPGDKPNKKSKIVTPPRKEKNYLTFKWTATDPNDDKLKYNLFLKRVEDKNWIPLKEDITMPRTEINTRLFEDGKYQLKVEADDSLANPPSTSRTATLISSPFLIDSTAPVVTGFTAQSGQLRFTVTDDTSIIAKVLYSNDGKMWFPVFPVDMIADSRSENYDFKLRNIKKYIFIKVMDEFSNSRVFQKELR